jgi:hypothetical protein
MNRFSALILGAAVLVLPARAHACATCFGAAGDPQTEGRNAAILTLLITTYTLFAGMIAAAFLLWRRARKLAATNIAPDLAEADRG